MQIPVMPFREVYPTLLPPVTYLQMGVGHVVDNGALGFVKRLSFWDSGNFQNFNREIYLPIDHV